ncbi:LPS export ABC transporter periplasmic protein LptC [Caldovatus aquaticus]|uniref:LPS export ABC transporter periplasmic protein LptC n=1 Tax=Caldovatus aquaticus TaxID=2865671 RepID=A0ABS7F4P1_9PROT|nr:LPS export ABC transporter periplasmic protein LptC [Caldovatus aquaticus]MBW8270587.1 LPS export ABC transporter periplasmic protein LptC [Caldovatus aquaticus]
MAPAEAGAGPGGALAQRPPPARGGAAAVAAGRRTIPPPSRERRIPTARQMARRAFLLRWAKRILPLLGVALLLSIALWSEYAREDNRLRIGVRGLGLRPDAMSVLRPRYQGVDERSRPFTVTAELAVQNGDEDVLTLEAPRADILLEDGAWLLLEARQGRYSKERGRLDLDGQVTLYHDNGTMLTTEHAAIALAEGAAQGDAPVAAQGPFGTLVGEGFRLRDRGAVVEVTGRSRAVLEGESGTP